ncbi:MAG: hypothetical protein ACRDU8_10375 [Egibacteraceae bacterium]
MHVGILVYEGAGELDALMRGEPVEIVAERVVWDGPRHLPRGDQWDRPGARDRRAPAGRDRRVHLEAVLERETPVSDRQEGAAAG